MNTQHIFLTIAVVAIVACCTGGGFYAFNVVEDAQATGGAGDIKGLIDPIIERAITALQNNNTDLALEEITTLKNELDDTFSADKAEDAEEEEEEDDKN